MLDALPILPLLLSCTSVSAATRYVWQGSPSPGPPYNDWATAARVIQDAVDVALAGDEVVVTNGTYASGGRAVGTNLLVNRVAVDKPLTLRSVNGPEFTVIQGYQVPGTTNGDGAIRCVYLANGATLSGFTVTNGATHAVNDWTAYREQSGGGVWCESTNTAVTNCIITGNSAGGDGGGAYGGTLNNCTLTGNSAVSWGGGADGGTLNNCTLTGNSAGGDGGGAAGGTLNNCTLTGNSTLSSGGGAINATLNNCMLTGNSADHGGGTYGGTLNNCTVTGNFASSGGGVVYSEMGLRLNNCIVYHNTAPFLQNYDGGEFNYSCTTPDPGGVGNITDDPQLASANHLSVFSPCRGAGTAAYTTGTDIDGEAWATPPSIGCDEYHAGAVTGPLSVRIAVAFTNVAVGFPVTLTALIEGRTTFSVWDFGDGDFVLDQPWSTHAWTTPGDYLVALWAFNETYPEGVSGTVTVHVIPQPVHYVACDSGNPVPPYLFWATAATSIQDAVDAAAVPGALVLVSNGVYATGGRAVAGSMTNRVAVDKPLVVRSVNGPEFTIIQGYQVPGTTNGDGAIRCVYLANGVSLSGFTLTNGATRDWYGDSSDSGGGVWCISPNATLTNCIITGNSAWFRGGGAAGGTLNNCTLTGNSAWCGGGTWYSMLNKCTLLGNSADWAGGAAWGTLYKCLLTGNTAADIGGGVYESTLNNCLLTGNLASYGGGGFNATLNNCTLTGNSASGHGGGVSYGTLNNCIIYFNVAAVDANYSDYSALNYCCTTPMPTNGVGNITLDPCFVNGAGGNLRLQSNSPCINAGNNDYAPGPTDLDGLPRIVSGTVDIGAYEFQGPGSVISYAWLQHYGLPTDGSADATDPDADGHSTWQEWRCLTDPTDALSALRLLKPSRAGTNVTVSWQSVAGVNYFLERSANLSATLPFTPLATGIPGQPGTTSYTDTNAATAPRFFYRVSVGQ